jgi:hypothetical protein
MTGLHLHVGHRITLAEAVEQEWDTTWKMEPDAAPRLWRASITEETVLDRPGPKLYCHDCDLWLTDFDVPLADEIWGEA